MDNNEVALKLKKLAEIMVARLVKTPAAVAITVRVTPSEAEIYVLVAPGEAGLVIGKKGRTVDAIRIVFRAAGMAFGIHRTLFQIDDGTRRRPVDTAN